MEGNEEADRGNTSSQPEKRSLGEVLRGLRYKRGIPQKVLADRINISQSTLSKWESGQSYPNREMAQFLASALELDDLHTQLLFNALEGKGATGVVSGRMEVPFSGSVITHYAHPMITDDKIQGLQAQFKDVENAISELSARLEGATTQSAQTVPISEEIEILKQNFAELKNTSQSLTAPVKIPSQEHMQVHLVPAASLERLEEYRSDESTWWTWFGLFVGSIIGVFINAATGGRMTTEAWILIGVFIIMAGLTGWFALKSKRKGSELSKKLLN